MIRITAVKFSKARACRYPWYEDPNAELLAACEVPQKMADDIICENTVVYALPKEINPKGGNTIRLIPDWAAITILDKLMKIRLDTNDKPEKFPFDYWDVGGHALWIKPRYMREAVDLMSLTVDTPHVDPDHVTYRDKRKPGEESIERIVTKWYKIQLVAYGKHRVVDAICEDSKVAHYTVYIDEYMYAYLELSKFTDTIPVFKDRTTMENKDVTVVRIKDYKPFIDTIRKYLVDYTKKYIEHEPCFNEKYRRDYRWKTEEATDIMYARYDEIVNVKESLENLCLMLETFMNVTNKFVEITIEE